MFPSDFLLKIYTSGFIYSVIKTSIYQKFDVHFYAHVKKKNFLNHMYPVTDTIISSLHLISYFIAEMLIVHISLECKSTRTLKVHGKIVLRCFWCNINFEHQVMACKRCNNNLGKLPAGKSNLYTIRFLTRKIYTYFF